MANSITSKSIFGEYAVGENQVTAALLQLLRLGGTELIGYLFADVDLDLDVHVNTQVVKNECHPDGEIFSKFHIYIECKITKLTKAGHDADQLDTLINLAQVDSAVVLYITTDKTMPSQLLNRSEIAWMNWEDVINRLQTFAPKFNQELMSFMIEQFVLLVENKVYRKHINTNDPNKSKRVIIVPGRYGEEFAAKYKIYACQPDRFFKPADFLAFYWNKRIRDIYRIVDGPVQVDGISEQGIQDNESHTLYRLEPLCDDKGNKVTLNVTHEEPSAFTQRQRYVEIDSLINAKTTADLKAV